MEGAELAVGEVQGAGHLVVPRLRHLEGVLGGVGEGVVREVQDPQLRQELEAEPQLEVGGAVVRDVQHLLERAANTRL